MSIVPPFSKGYAEKKHVHVRLISFSLSPPFFFLHIRHDRLLRLYTNVRQKGILFNYTWHYTLLRALKRHSQDKTKFD